jgi:ankyrin repeat protein
LPLIKGHASVVTLLLADERLDPNIADQGGNTALTRAALNRYDSVVKLLLADERLDPNIADKSGITALILAAHQRARLGSDAAACRRAPGPKHRRPGWQHGTHLCRSQSLRLGGEAAACRRADDAVF